MRRRTVLLIVLAHLGLAIVLALLVLLADEPPPMDADLLPVRTKVAPGENGFNEVDLPAESFHLPRDFRYKCDIIAGTWDAALAAPVLEEHEAVLMRFDSALKCPRFQLP